MAENIIQSNATQTFVKDLCSYAIGVNRRRMIPDFRDGFKPVQRRIIYTAYKLKAIEPKLIKSQRIVGDTMGNYHPHGDTSIYETIPLLANDFNAKLPLFYTKGNWGTIMGDDAAAARYTECSLNKFALENVIGELAITDNTVFWEDNYDGTTKEPIYLPIKLPLLLINGASGVGVGMTCEIPRHNPIDVIECTQSIISDMINGTDKTEVCLVPDQLQPTEIINTDFKQICDTGSGGFIVRGLVESVANYDKKGPAVIIKSLPDRVYTNSIVDKLNDLAAKKQLPMVREVVDLSQDTVNIVIKLVKDANPEYVKSLLYKKTMLEKKFNVNMEVVEDINPRRFTYKEYLISFILQRRITKKRLYTAQKSDIDTKIHRLETFIQVMESGDIDYIIDKVKKSNSDSDKELIEFMINKYNFTDIQCEFILRASIRSLSLARLNKYKEEIKCLKNESNTIESKILDDSIAYKEIYDELEKIKDWCKSIPAYSSRKSVIVSADNEIPEGEFTIVITENNYIRKLVSNDVNVVKKDMPVCVLRISNRDSLLLFDNVGKVFKLPVHKVPVCNKSDSGIYLGSLVKLLTANVIQVLTDSLIEKANANPIKPYIVVLGRNNSIKKIDIADFITIPTSGTTYYRTTNKDEKVSTVALVDNRCDILVSSGNKILRLGMDEVPLLKRSARGYNVVNTKKDTTALAAIYNNQTDVIILTESGRVTRLSISNIPKQGRCKEGIPFIKLASDDSVYGIYPINNTITHMTIMTNYSPAEVDLSKLDYLPSSSVGLKAIKAKTGKIVSVSFS